MPAKRPLYFLELLNVVSTTFMVARPLRVKFQQRYQKRHGSLFKPLCAKVLCGLVTPDCRPDSSSQFGSVIPTGSRTVVAEICYHNITEPLATTCRSAPIVLRAHWRNGSGQKVIARGYHTTGADLCTTSSKKHELNLSKARSGGAISYVAFGTFVGI